MRNLIPSVLRSALFLLATLAAASCLLACTGDDTNPAAPDAATETGDAGGGDATTAADASSGADSAEAPDSSKATDSATVKDSAGQTG